MSNNIDLNLDNILDDLSMNIYNLKNNYQVNDVSNQIIVISNKINDLNNKIEKVIDIYTMINELNQRLNIS